MGQQIIEIENPKLIALLKYWINLMTRIMGKPIQYVFLYEMSAKEPTKLNSILGSLTKAIGRASQQILGTHMTVNSFRHAHEMAIQESPEYQRATMAERTEMHRKLLHGTMMGQIYNWRRRDNVGELDSNNA